MDTVHAPPLSSLPTEAAERNGSAVSSSSVVKARSEKSVPQLGHEMAFKPVAEVSDENADDNIHKALSENTPTLPALSIITPLTKKRAKSARVSVCDARCRSSLRAVRAAVKRLGWEEITHDTAECSVMWLEHHDSAAHLTPHQVASKIESLIQLCRKSAIATLINRMQVAFPMLYQFVPRTWILRRDDYEEALSLETAMNEKKGWVYICKPSAGSEGRGLQLVKKWSDLKGVLKEVWPNGNEENAPPRRRRPEYVVQKYITRPLLVEGLKFDCRIYVVITSILPLTGYIFEEGLAKFCTVPYERPKAKNLSNAYMHLTNYSVNKHSEQFHSSRAHDCGTKRSLSSVLQKIESDGGPSSQTLWDSIKELCERTLLAIQPAIVEIYATGGVKVGLHPHGCKGFQIIGFDILFEENYRLRLLEVNSNPSMSCLTPMADPESTEFQPIRKPDGGPKMEVSTLDFAIKVELIAQTLLLVNPLSHRKAMLGRQEFLERSGGLPPGAVFSEPIPSAAQRKNANPPRRPDRPRRGPALQPLDFFANAHAEVAEAVGSYETIYRIYRSLVNKAGSSVFGRSAFRGLCEVGELLTDGIFEDQPDADVFFAQQLRDASKDSMYEGLGFNYPMFLRCIAAEIGKKLDARSEIHSLMAFASRCSPESVTPEDYHRDASPPSSTEERSPARSRLRLMPEQP